MYLRLSCACMCMCQGNQSTRYQTGQPCRRSHGDLCRPAVYLQPVKSYPGMMQICLTCRHIIQFQHRTCLCSRSSHLHLSWNNSINSEDRFGFFQVYFNTVQYKFSKTTPESPFGQRAHVQGGVKALQVV